MQGGARDGKSIDGLYIDIEIASLSPWCAAYKFIDIVPLPSISSIFK